GFRKIEYMQSVKYLLLFAAVLCTVQTLTTKGIGGKNLGGVNGTMGRLFEANTIIVLDGCANG
ncbi:hypothetical protein, partial [Burkholderia sp. SIMBA_062]|uniref:hypothetical protein n=1 Tax=Burkholderia sp. SIMBA_062 TaxID=3085803 RepID=UPI00397D056F